MLYMEKYSIWFQSLLVIILSLKVLFLACVAWRIYAKRTNQLEQVQYMEILTDILHKSYSVLMSVLLMLLFSNIINVGEVLKHDLWWDKDKCLQYGLVDEVWLN